MANKPNFLTSLFTFTYINNSNLCYTIFYKNKYNP